MKQLSIQHLLHKIPEFNQTSGLTFTRSHIEALYNVRQTILSDIQQHHELPLLARQANMNEHDLKKRFKIVFEKTIYELLMESRLEHAKLQIANSQKPVSQIAFECGYRNAEYFTNFFKRNTGLTPSQFRKLFNTGVQLL